ncbi:MAG: tetratricopeptide repeat protein [Rhodobacter sp.]|nr:tetratricopeptide repeat protein [Rhodobacter sp.]MBK8440513.1 tetratricopeptide repeat protein [Rhodobacter sp.]
MQATRRPALAALLMTAALVAGALHPAAAQEAAANDQVTAEVVTAGASGDSGAYLAARVAESENDFRAAAAWYERALLADPANPSLIEGAIYAELGLGNFDKARVLAEGLGDAAKDNQLAGFAFDATEAAAGDYAALIAAAADGRKVGPLLDELVVAWAKLGEGRMADALKDFDAVSEMHGMEAVGLYHKALALAVAGDFEGAEKILSGEAAGPINLNRRGVIARVQILSQLERNADALVLLDQTFGTEPEPALDALRARLQAGEPLPFAMIPDARAGIAEVFFTIGTLLLGESDPAYVLMHSRVANHLDPANDEALLLTAQALEDLEQHDLAVETYARFPKNSPAFYSAEIGRSDALYAAGRKEAAIEVLQALARGYPELVVVHSSLADILRREDRCAEAVASYDAALALVPKVDQVHWTLFFSRGICHEKLKTWDKAEADFRRALDLRPGQPQVLNYLGYSLVDRGLKLDEALELIQAAVRAEPEAGYIIDSLAWAYFRLGRYEEALAPMEKASVLEPVDPVVTDHLGDVYWMVDRKREAEFQWHRALSFGPEEKEAVRIRRKLEVGLDAVMKEEVTGPTAPSPSMTPVENDN